MRKVHLLGTLKEKFGEEWEAECETIAEIFQLIDCQTNGFKHYMIQCAENGINFSIRYGKDFIEYPEELKMNLPEHDIYITDVPAGASATAKIIAAVAIIALLWWNPMGWVTAAGVGGFSGAMSATAGQIAFAIALNLAISGINELLMPTPDKGAEGGYFFNGPVNTIKQGQPVPLLYGRMIIGGAPISVTYTKRVISSSGYVYNGASTTQGDFDAISNLNPSNLGV
jgi:predicted phage tail protein